MNPIEISLEQFKFLCEQFLAIATDYLKEMDARSIPSKGSGAEIDRIFHALCPETGLADEALRARQMRAVRAVGNVLFFGRADHDAMVLRSRVIEEFHAPNQDFIQLGHFDSWEPVSGDDCLAVSRNVRDESRP